MADGTYYSLLEISEAVSAAEIKTAYLRLIREVHPDRLANAPAYWQRQAEQKTKEINEAYSILSNREKRRLYDEQLAARRRWAGASSRQTPSQAWAPSSTSSANQQSQTSSGPHGGSTANASSAGTYRSTYRQQQTASTSAASANESPQSSRPPFASSMESGPRFFIAVILSIFGVVNSRGGALHIGARDLPN